MNISMRPCPNHPGYSVTNDGRVFSHRTRRSLGYRKGSESVISPTPLRELSQSISPKDYRCVSIWVDKLGKDRKVCVHVLVLEAFIGPCPVGQIGRHLDDDKSNNSIENLAWGTHQQNVDDRLRNGGYPAGEDHPNAKITDEQAASIRQFRADGMKIREICTNLSVSLGIVENVIYQRGRFA